MRVAVVSDIHGNQRAFHAIVADLKDASPDMVVHGGDLVFGGTHPAEIIDEIRALGWAGVLGNTDELLWTQERLKEIASAHPKLALLLGRLQEMIAPMRARIGSERLCWLKMLPVLYTAESFAVVHASPNDLWRAPMVNASNEEIQETYEQLSVPTVTYGHIHVSYVRRLHGMTVANAGSVSQSYDGDTRAAYAVIERGNVAIRRVEYDVESEAKELLHSGLPHAEWLSRILLTGKYWPPG
ncbi:MAG TPA: metallophosphoesterase family protein [Terriglobales bacterium]|nr:metallophosphoesterase family protein [Terriglobales bacterium]